VVEKNASIRGTDPQGHGVLIEISETWETGKTYLSPN
jgi:hypothetical protein